MKSHEKTNFLRRRNWLFTISHCCDINCYHGSGFYFWMNMKYLTLLVVLFSIGCSGDSSSPKPAPTKMTLEEQKISKLPPDAKIIKKKNDTWWIVEIDGTKYLAQWMYMHNHGYIWQLTSK